MTALRRAIVVVLDGVGVGANPDASAYGDEGASSLVKLGERSTFADLGQTLAQTFGVGPLAAGTSFAHELDLL